MSEEMTAELQEFNLKERRKRMCQRLSVVMLQFSDSPMGSNDNAPNSKDTMSHILGQMSRFRVTFVDGFRRRS